MVALIHHRKASDIFGQIPANALPGRDVWPRPSSQRFVRDGKFQCFFRTFLPPFTPVQERCCHFSPSSTRKLIYKSRRDLSWGGAHNSVLYGTLSLLHRLDHLGALVSRTKLRAMLNLRSLEPRLYEKLLHESARLLLGVATVCCVFDGLRALSYFRGISGRSHFRRKHAQTVNMRPQLFMLPFSC